MTQPTGVNPVRVRVTVGGSPALAEEITVNLNVRFGRPTTALTVQQENGNIIISWPLAAVDYDLESAAAVGDPASWQRVTTPRQSNAEEYFVIEPVDTSTRIFRLRERSSQPDGPRLIARISGASFVLSWPASYGSAEVQWTRSAAESSTWQRLETVPRLVGENYEVTLPRNQAAAFYRLQLLSP